MSVKKVKRVSKSKTTKKAVVKKVSIWDKAKSYVGIKQIDAVSMTRGAYNKFRGWTIPANENPKDKGFMVRYPDGYISWSPKEQFDLAYMTGNNLDFSAAIYLLKKGYKLARKGWNSKKMWIMYVPGTEKAKFRKGTPYAKAGLTEGTINGHIDMMTANGSMQPGWLASQTDMLAEDWCIVQ